MSRRTPRDRFSDVLVGIGIGVSMALLLVVTAKEARSATTTRPTPPPMSTAHASCYELFGNNTANGTKVTRRTIGVAHRTLPFGTRIWIKSNGRSVVAKVIDRGPFVSGRTFDLTHGTVVKLGFRYAPTPCRHFGHRDIKFAVLRRR